MSNKTRLGPYAASKLIINGIQIFDAPLLAVVGPREDEISIIHQSVFGFVPVAPEDAVLFFDQSVVALANLPKTVSISRQSVMALANLPKTVSILRQSILVLVEP